MKNKDIAAMFRRMGTLLELQGENVFKIRAYFKAADNIDGLAEDLAVVQAEGRLDEIPGIGKALAEKIAEYLATGKMSAYEKVTAVIPESILAVIEIPSVGPKKAKLFYDELGVKDIAGLKQAAASGQLLSLPGIKEKTAENILNGIKIVEQGLERMTLGEAFEVAESIVGALRILPDVKRIEVAGSLRRRKESVRDIDILVLSVQPAKVMDAFVTLPQVRSVNAHGETKSSVLTKNGVQVDLRIVEPESFGAALLYFTGSKNFNVKLRQWAVKQSIKINEYGIYSEKGGKEKRLAGKTEEECFKVLGMPYIPPELREDIGEQLIFDGNAVRPDIKIPKLIEERDIQGDLHVHSLWSDGHFSIAAIAEAARRRGYRYVAITDHSARLKVAKGLSVEDLLKKRREIDQVNKQYSDFRVLFGTEAEIDSDGNVDYDEKILREFEIVIAALHVGLEQDREQMTRRLVKACENKYVHILAHPTGVHAGKREPYDMDLKAVCQAAAATNTFLEINAFPIRLDLNSQNVFFSREHGAQFVINTDTHSLEHLDFMKFGVAIARRAWLTKRSVLNTLSLTDMLKKLKKH